MGPRPIDFTAIARLAPIELLAVCEAGDAAELAPGGVLISPESNPPHRQVWVSKNSGFLLEATWQRLDSGAAPARATALPAPAAGPAPS